MYSRTLIYVRGAGKCTVSALYNGKHLRILRLNKKSLPVTGKSKQGEIFMSGFLRLYLKYLYAIEVNHCSRDGEESGVEAVKESAMTWNDAS